LNHSVDFLQFWCRIPGKQIEQTLTELKKVMA
jgi:hypothetical protein